jgi:hypothetical protein
VELRVLLQEGLDLEDGFKVADEAVAETDLDLKQVK